MHASMRRVRRRHFIIINLLLSYYCYTINILLSLYTHADTSGVGLFPQALPGPLELTVPLEDSALSPRY